MLTIQLRTRLITAGVMIAVILFLLYCLTTKLPLLQQFAFGSFVVLTFLGILELAIIGSAAVHNAISRYTFLLFFCLPLIGYLLNNFYADIYLPMDMIVLASAMFFCSYGIIIGRENLYLMNNLYRFLFPAFIVLFGLLSLLHLIIAEKNVWLVLWLITIVAVNDSMAYFIGRKFGKRPLAPAISPKKTVAGLWGGIAISVILGSALLGSIYPDYAIWVNILMTCLVAIMAVFGDLIESYLKRNAGLKDSSNLLPGHGGILDRIDGLLMAAPIVLIFNSFYLGV